MVRRALNCIVTPRWQVSGDPLRLLGAMALRFDPSKRTYRCTGHNSVRISLPPVFTLTNSARLAQHYQSKSALDI